MTQHNTKDGRTFIIRRPADTDAAAIISYSKALFASTDQLLTVLEEYIITVEQEKIWINYHNKQANALVLVAEMDNQIIGLLFFAPGPKKKITHIGEFGVSVHPGYQGQGIGRLLIETLLQWAKANPAIEKVYLNVFHTNQAAIQLYQALGFIEEGRHVKHIKQPGGEYVDVVQMYVETK